MPTPSIATLQREAEEARIAYEQAEEARRRLSPQYLRAQAEIREAKYAEAMEQAEAERQRIAHDVHVLAGEHSKALEAAITALATYLDARDELADLDDRYRLLLRQARDAEVSAIPARDGWELRTSRSGEVGRTARALQQRAQTILSRRW